MSHQNLNKVRDSFATFARGDVDAAFKDATPNFALDIPRAGDPDRDVRNLAQTRQLAEQVVSSEGLGQYETSEFIEAGEQVMTPVRLVPAA